MIQKFIHLNLHTEYSIADGIVRIDQLFDKCVKSNIPACALTDQSNLFAVVKFYRQAMDSGVKPIIGVDIWLENDLDQRQPFKLILLAKNYLGYQNILKLISKSYIEGQVADKPIVRRSWLNECASGLIVLSGAKDGDIGSALLANNFARVNTLIKFWQKLFPDNYYLEIRRTGRVKEEEYLALAFDLAVKEHLPLVATNSVCFLEREDFEAHEARVCINSGYVLGDSSRPVLYSQNQYLRSSEEMEELFSDIPESLANSVEIATRCNVELTFGRTLLPIFPTPNKNVTPEEYFIQQSHEGLINRANEIDNQDGYKERLDYEIKVINQMGFASYFLIVADFIGWAKKNGIPVGPGRGSGAGSLVAYVLGITDIDPIKHDLLFERFLNPERVSMPDFDIDFCMDGRDRVINYVMDRYGRDKVAQIITYGTMAARAVVRDVGRVLGFAYGYVDKIAKLIPFALGMTLKQAMEEEELLQQRYNVEDEVKTLIDLAKKLEGIVRNAGKHAGGVVIAPSALTDFMPLYREEDSEGIITQLDKDDVEAVGLVKFDFLGLRTLTIIDWALKAIDQRLISQGKGKLDISSLPLDDLSTYKLLQSGKTAAIFQLESRISRDLIKRFKPDCFSDIVALVAIIRPGVLQSGMLDEIIDRKHGRARITYLHPKLEPILKPTYGVAIYQEQVMQMAQSLAGYSLGGADLLRRAMGKKKPEEMARQRAVFIEGADKSGMDKHLANVIFDFMEKFASYGFNKSHSAAYALIAYQTAWLKAHYPAEFMAAVLSSDMDNTDKVVMMLNECRELNLGIIKPDINSSNYQFTVSKSGNEIIYGLGAIKGVGSAASELIIADRNLAGEFKNLFDLCKRVDCSKVNKRVLEALISSGALDKIGPSRAQLFASVEEALKLSSQHEKQRFSGQLDLLGGLFAEDDEYEYLPALDWSNDERLKKEKEVLGFYLDGHPIEKFREELNKFVRFNLAEIAPEVGKNILIAGFINSIRLVNTKSGNRLAIITLEDNSGSVDVTMFAENFAQARSSLVEDRLVIIEGEVVADQFSNGYRIRASRAMSLEQAREVYVKGLLLNIDGARLSQDALHKLYDILGAYRGGNCPVFINYDNGKNSASLELSDEWKVYPKDELLVKLKDEFSFISTCFIY